jgi:hypothetical protein
MQRWQNLWFDRNLGLQNCLPLDPELQLDPLFILGLWRSGTTSLHDLLGACPGMLHPATWQCMSPASFRLQQPPTRGNAVRRPMDGLMIDNLSPQEDEFALLALGVPTVYRGFLDPRRLPELTQWLNPDAWTADQPPGWVATWRQFLTGVVAGRCGRLVVKSPNHSFRIRALAQLFPRAAYVWLVRDPADTFFSNRKMWLTMFDRYAIWPWDPSVLDNFLCRAFEKAAECLQLATAQLPRDRCVVVNFDELTKAPVATLDRINDRLHLGNREDIHTSAGFVAAAKAGYRAETYSGRDVPQPTRQAISQLHAAQETAMESHGL